MAKKKPIEIDGVEYPSRIAAAKAYGVTKSTLSRAIKTGRLHTLGVGRGTPKSRLVFGIQYQSLAEAALDLNINKSDFCAAIRFMDRFGIDYTQPRT